jgi:tRNA dimethylallyltransferase
MARILVIAGPTAVGKSALSIALAQRLNGEIISADSMQIYRCMDIGTAKATVEERASVVHHLIDIKDPSEEYSCADYATDARRCIDDILSRGKVPIFCGGTGLYIKQALCEAPVASPPSDPELRQMLETRSPEENYDELCKCDPESAKVIHPNNVRRVIRALEIYRLSGIPKSQWDKENPSEVYRSDALLLCLTSPREQLYNRIDRRVERMMEQGLYEEVASLDLDPSTTAGQAIGYKEMLGCVAGLCSKEEAVIQIQLASRRYAKRQLTWFRHQNGFNMIDVSEFNNFEEIVNFVVEMFERSKNVI